MASFGLVKPSLSPSPSPSSAVYDYNRSTVPYESGWPQLNLTASRAAAKRCPVIPTSVWRSYHLSTKYICTVPAGGLPPEYPNPCYRPHIT